uniref:ATP synthase complex subunit 8 n=1 Tax=Psychomantis borneensis TaxID=627839 RepID=A0A6C0S165_9NEOP|nr:ATP synthase F0 subunit 8 [Psychomantis borneensis]QIA48596.1 ATP synthase F0 subunit 8 [Psychomantis borneensis]
MPQMMPLNWLMLFSFFSILLIMFNVMNYYSPFNKMMSSSSTKTSIKSLIWKW